jgi:hypothetical protein
VAIGIATCPMFLKSSNSRMNDEIRISRDDLARDLRVHLRVIRQKEPQLLRNLAALKDARGYPDHAAEDKALAAFAEDIADWMQLTGKRVVRDRGRSPEGAPERTAAELGIEARPSAQV